MCVSHTLVDVTAGEAIAIQNKSRGAATSEGPISVAARGLTVDSIGITLVDVCEWKELHQDLSIMRSVLGGVALTVAVEVISS